MCKEMLGIRNSSQGCETGKKGRWYKDVTLILPPLGRWALLPVGSSVELCEICLKTVHSEDKREQYLCIISHALLDQLGGTGIDSAPCCACRNTERVHRAVSCDEIREVPEQKARGNWPPVWSEVFSEATWENLDQAYLGLITAVVVVVRDG